MRGVWVGAVVVAVLAFAGSARGGSVFVVQGAGYGHGVGLSQYGAEGYALHGWSYRRILAHYYPGTELERVKPRPVRVLLAEQREKVAIASSKPFLLVDARGRRVHVQARTLRFGPRLRLGGKPLRPPVQVEAGAAPLSLDGAAYRGDLVLHVREGKLEVVNVLPLDRYLRAVVPSEMPWQWQPDAYRAQAVVARSYALATLHPGADYDLYSDERDQVYGGIAAERRTTSLAVGATAGQVLTYDGHVITAYYSASSGGRTAYVHDVFPKFGTASYLVPVRDPYDTLSPWHRWTRVLRPAALSRTFDVPVSDVRVERDASGRVARVLLSGDGRTTAVAGRDFEAKLGLRSTLFSVRVLSLDEPARTAVYGKPTALHGFVRGLGGVVLQRRTPGGSWRQVERIRTHSDGRFAAVVRPRGTGEFRIAAGGVAGDPVEVEVARRIAVRTDGSVIAGTVVPATPVRIERRVAGGWKKVASVPVGPSGFFRRHVERPGRYRVAAPAGARYLASASRPVRLRR